MRSGLAAALLLFGSALASPARPEQGLELERPALEAALAAEDALRNGEWELAESRIRSGLLEALLLRGTLDVAEGRFEQAEVAFSHAERAVASPRRARLATAALALHRGRAEEALRILRSVASRHPTDTRSRRLLAQVLALEGRLSEAIQELEEIHRLVPDDAESTFALAAARLHEDDDEAAARLFAALQTQRPGPATAVLVGRSYLDRQRYPEARRWLREALSADPGARRAHYYLGKVALAAEGYGGLEAAVGHFRAELGLAPEDPLASLHLGLTLAELRRCDEALAPLARATENPGTALDAWRFLGKCHLAAGRSEDARSALERALAIARESGSDRQRESVHYQLATALRRLGHPGAEDHFLEAERLSSRLVDADRANLVDYLEESAAPPPLFAIAPVGLELLEPIGALGPPARQDLRRRVDGHVARAYSNLGTLLARASRPTRAAGRFSDAASFDPDLPGLARNLGTASFQAGRYDEAAAALVRALDEAPGDVELTRALALTRVRLGEYPGAAALLEEDPGRSSDPGLQYAYALALVRSGHGGDAAAAFDDLLRSHPDWPELHVLLGQARASEGDFPGAIESLQQALSLRGDVAEAHATLGEIHLRQGRLDAAEAAFRSELQHRPDAADVRHELALVLDLRSRPDEAIEELERILTSRPDFVDARYLLGKILLSGGRAEAAKAHLGVAAEGAPEDPNIRYQLGLAHQRLGETDAARAQFDRYRELKAAEREGGS